MHFVNPISSFPSVFFLEEKKREKREKGRGEMKKERGETRSAELQEGRKEGRKEGKLCRGRWRARIASRERDVTKKRRRNRSRATTLTLINRNGQEHRFAMEEERKITPSKPLPPPPTV